MEGDENQVLAIDAVLTVESFKEKGWAVVPLLKGGMNIAEAETGEATLHLGKNGDELILPKKGQYEIKLKLYAKVNRSKGRQSVAVDFPVEGTVYHFQKLKDHAELTIDSSRPADPERGKWLLWMLVCLGILIVGYGLAGKVRSRYKAAA